MKVDFGGNAHAAAVRENERRRAIYDFNRDIDARNAEFVEALRREGKTKRQLMQERLAELVPELEACHYSDPPLNEVYNLIEAVEEFLGDSEKVWVAQWYDTGSSESAVIGIYKTEDGAKTGIDNYHMDSKDCEATEFEVQ